MTSSGRRPHSQDPRQLELVFDVPPAAPPEARDLTHRAREILRRAGAHRLAARVQVSWRSRLRTTAGLAHYAKALVLLNPRIAAFGAGEIERTLIHELAHLLAQDRAGKRRIAPHGREWRLACRDLGLPGEKRCHTLPLPRRTITRRHVYRCPACDTEVRRVRPFRVAVACMDCCRKYASGRYDERFRLVKKRV